MLMHARVALETTLGTVTHLGGLSPLSFGFSVVSAVILHAGWAMIWVVVAGVLTFIVVRFQTTSTEIAGRKVAWESGNDIMVTVVQ